MMMDGIEILKAIPKLTVAVLKETVEENIQLKFWINNDRVRKMFEMQSYLNADPS